MTTNTPKTSTEVGNYFVSNYPPFSQWKPEYIPDAIEALDQSLKDHGRRGKLDARVMKRLSGA